MPAALAFILPLVLHLLLPLLATASGAAITWVVAREAWGFGLLKARTKSAQQAEALGKLEHLTETATSAVLSKVAADVGAGVPVSNLAMHAMEALKQSVSLDDLKDLAFAAAGVGVDEFEWYLRHLLAAKTADKVLTVPVGATAGKTLAEVRAMVAKDGVPAQGT